MKQRYEVLYALLRASLPADGAKAIKGGGGKGADVAMAGGGDAGGIDEALRLSAEAAGVAN